MKMGQGILDPGLTGTLNQKGIVHRQQRPEQRKKLIGFKILDIPVEILHIGEIFVVQEIGFGGLVGIKVPDVFFMLIVNGIFAEDDQKRVLGLKFNGRDSGPGFEFPQFHERIRRFHPQKIIV
jgi:hypothetical protein